MVVVIVKLLYFHETEFEVLFLLSAKIKSHLGFENVACLNSDGRRESLLVWEKRKEEAKTKGSTSLTD